MSKQTNRLTGGSCEPTMGSTAVVFEDNAPSLCPPLPAHAFALAQLNCHLLMASPSHDTHTHSSLCEDLYRNSALRIHYSNPKLTPEPLPRADLSHRTTN